MQKKGNYFKLLCYKCNIKILKIYFIYDRAKNFESTKAFNDFFYHNYAFRYLKKQKSSNIFLEQFLNLHFNFLSAMKY